MELSQNNNATAAEINKAMDCDGDDEGCKILARSQEEIQKQEEAEMMKFVEFMKKQGLVMVQQNEQPIQKKTPVATTLKVVGEVQ